MTATLNLYWTPPQKEAKAAKEIRQAGHKAYVPRQRRATGKGYEPTARGYIAADAKPTRIGGRFQPVRDDKGDIIGLRQDEQSIIEPKNVGRCIGPVSRAELRRLYVRTSATQRRHTYAPGDTVSIKRGPHTSVTGTVVEIHRAHWYDVRVTMLGKSHVVKLRESDLVRLHPGS
jgi:transcription antitermination factor NusG